MIHIKAIIFTISATLCIAVGAQDVRFHNESADTIRINDMLEKAVTIENPNTRIATLGRMFIDTRYVAGTLESDNGEEILTVNLDELDCTTFIDNVMALGITAGEGRRSWRDFIYNLRNTRYRGGETKGYASRLHYISDWVVDNVHRGNFDEVTNRCLESDYVVKTLDFMSQNRNLYPTLSDDAIYEGIKTYEIGYRNHRFPIIKTKNISKAAKSFLKEGDIVALTTAKKGLDVTHMGILIFQGQTPYLLHASSREGKVVIDKRPLSEYMQRDHTLTGIRVFRLKE